MKSITITGSKRESVGKVNTKALRNAGKVPCVLYGGDKPFHFSADETSFKQLVYTGNVYTATIELEGTTYPMGQVNHNELKLRGFKWLVEKRPKSKFEILTN